MASAQEATGDSWLHQWIGVQRGLLESWRATPQPQQASLLAKEWDSWWRATGQHASDPARSTLEKMQAAGNEYLGGLAQFLHKAQGLNPSADPATTGTQSEFAQGPFAGQAQWWSHFPALGLARESVEITREVAQAQAECEQLAIAAGQVLARLQGEALDLLERRVSERLQASRPISSYRELYDLWIECGEEIYAQTARSEPFTSLQTRYSAAALRLKGAQQKLAEQSLRSLDLPTRAELNGVHQKLRDLHAALARLESTAKKTPTPKSSQKRKPSVKGKGRRK